MAGGIAALSHEYPLHYALDVAKHLAQFPQILSSQGATFSDLKGCPDITAADVDTLFDGIVIDEIKASEPYMQAVWKDVFGHAAQFIFPDGCVGQLSSKHAIEKAREFYGML